MTARSCGLHPIGTQKRTGSLGSGTYTYDGGGLRVKKVSGSTTTVYIFSGSKVIAEYVNGAAPGSPTREYIYSGGTLVAKIESGATQYYHQDVLSVRLMTDASGNKIGEQGHFPYGEQWYAASTTTKWQYTTYERDAESGNDYAMAREYVNRLGRFSALDPMAGSTADPQSLNKYPYAGSDPVNNVDPTGECFAIDGSCVDNIYFSNMLPYGFGWSVFDILGFATQQTGWRKDITDYYYRDPETEKWGLFAQSASYSPIYGNMGLLGLLGLGGGNSSDMTKPWELRSDVVALLRASNGCSDWFNQGTGSAADIMSHVPILLYTPKEPYYDMPDANTGDNPQTPINVNSLGRFYTDRYNSNSVGGYSAGSFGARSVILLHELAHKVMPPGFIANDADTPGASDKNTQAVIDHCATAINAQKQ